MPTAPGGNLPEGFYLILKHSTFAVNELRFRLRNNNNTPTTVSATETLTGSAAVDGNGFNFDTVDMGSVSSDFNELELSVGFDATGPSGLWEVAVWDGFGTQSPGGNTVTVNSPSLEFPSGETGTRWIAQRGTDANPGQLSYQIQVRDGSSIIETEGYSSMSVPTARDRIETTSTVTVTSSSGGTPEIDTFNLRVDGGSAMERFVNGGDVEDLAGNPTTFPNFVSGAKIDWDSLTVFYT